MARNRNLLTTLRLLYQMQDADIMALADELLERRKVEWVTALNELAVQHGCQRGRANAPRLGDLQRLRDMSIADARQIARTWNRDVERQLRVLFESNIRGNRFYYYSNMERWANERAAWKNPQIAIQTAQSTRWYAQERFREMNALRQRYIFTGPPPVCEECVGHFAAGIVDERYIRRNPTPIHIGCPHEWEALAPERIPCDEIWLG